MYDIPRDSSGAPGHAASPSREPVIDEGTASTLLRLGLDQHRPVDRLIDRLSAPDGASWLESALCWGPMQGEQPPREILVDSAPDLELLARIKEHSKMMVKSAVSGDEQLAGLAGYFLSIAAALRWHGTLLANRPRREVAEILLDLAAVAPQPYQELLGHAASALRS